MSWFKFKIKENRWQQMVYDVSYEEVCPICHILVKKESHFTVNEEKDFDKDPSWRETLMECNKCHIALWGKKVNVLKTLRTYSRDENAPIGLKIVKEEILSNEN